MLVIPVIDLLAGKVVHARRGDRANYRPIQSRLCPSAEPLAIMQALLQLHAFSTVYIADLDAIRGLGDNTIAIETLRRSFPHIEWWLDAGVADLISYDRIAKLPNTRVVIGSESIRDASLLQQLRFSMDPVLSLDHKDGEFLGAPILRTTPALWPSRLLAMNLSRVGSGEGPDIELMQTLQAARPDAAIYAAGGVRHGADLSLLREHGFAGALVATALHDGHLTAVDLAQCS